MSFLLTESVPQVQERYTIAEDPEQWGICGGSSGGNSAFTAAWFRPDKFRKVVGCESSFAQMPGGNPYPEAIAQAPRKPLRIVLQEGHRDLGWPFRLASQQKPRTYCSDQGRRSARPPPEAVNGAGISSIAGVGTSGSKSGRRSRCPRTGGMGARKRSSRRQLAKHRILGRSLAFSETSAQDSGVPGYIRDWAQIWRSGEKIVHGPWTRFRPRERELERNFDAQEIKDLKARVGRDLVVGARSWPAKASRLDLWTSTTCRLFPL